ncbi:uncharacterized protein DSM5745_04988 [Aspergillus mulundensis]|uniref:Uncharacterized protein n=1 Tax=Aspergillus mulundensis TaxID=1810919 RepID=A0A3D8S5U1_9EURO|nr:hypothetical protein DSM5745_04988 [Aspergillus mulundensis]RDW81431.1 hypothetical protein DSM5745_04988 [Aspergillus mulundensis]
MCDLPDLSSLKSSVRASPASRRAYRAARYVILQNILHNYYGGLVILSDAIAAVRSRGLSMEDDETKEAAIDLLDSRRQFQFVRPRDVDEIIELLRLHELANWFIEGLKKTMGCAIGMPEREWSPFLPIQVSGEERRRFYRGFYRL